VDDSSAACRKATVQATGHDSESFAASGFLPGLASVSSSFQEKDRSPAVARLGPFPHLGGGLLGHMLVLVLDIMSSRKSYG
jgi:hypothetical protein